MTEKTLPDIYREAADLVLNVGKVAGAYAEYEDGECLGYCTMGAALAAAGILIPGTDALDLPDEYIRDSNPKFVEIVKPISDQLISSRRIRPDEDHDSVGSQVFCNVYTWNDRWSERVTAEEVAQLFRETADAVEKKEG